MRKISKLFTLPVLFLVLLYPASAGAIPDLIVVPTGTNATYYGDPEPYLDYWADYFLPETEDYHGFAIPASGGYLSVAADFGDIGDLHIYLLIDNGGVNHDVSYGGTALQDVITTYSEIGGTTQIDGYKPQPYWGVDIGPIDPSSWTKITDPVFSSGNYYEYSAQLKYDSNLPDGLHFFAIVDDNSSNPKSFVGDDPNLNSNDTFSPMTASSGNFPPIPEPSTMLLLGCGLIGLAAFGRKKFKEER